MKQELPSLKPREVVEALERVGFSIKRQTGSHIILYKSGLRRPLSIPVHPKDLPKGTIRAIIRQANLTVEEFL
ncbi:MAG: type II toxin-antitoxin system HicA family toxin [Chloroflexi bacterium]|nr:type II toxin-antitoxin system HicA family toxin [Chloroflexota bacterium]